MNVFFTRTFEKQYWKLRETDRMRVDKAILIFRKNPLDPSLHNHTLKGQLKGQRSISAGYDLRLIFEERDGYTIVTMIDVGSHESVYE